MVSVSEIVSMNNWWTASDRASGKTGEEKRGIRTDIGLFDICSRACPEMMEQIRACSGRICDVADGRAARSLQKAKPIPMIAF